MNGEDSSGVRLDPRGVRFSAGVTTVVLGLVLVFGWVPLLVAQLAVFAAGAVLGPHRQPYGWLFKTFVRPRLSPPEFTEDAAAPRFAQWCGVVFTVGAVAGAGAGMPVVMLVFAAMAFAAAFLNAAFGFCLGCELYVRFRRVSARV